VAQYNGDEALSVHEPLAASVRRLIDVTIRSEVDASIVRAAKAHVDRAVEQLSEVLMPASFGVREVADGQPVTGGNVAIGVRNPIAPPLVIHRDADGAVWTDVTLGAAYEGPPGHVHGGVCALILDHVLGATAHQPGRPAYTGTLSLRYLRGTPLGLVRVTAHVDRIDGAKIFAVGHIDAGEGVTVTAEGVFIIPKRTPQ
jgi:acyl-coenzyme A thioesterase PaaI-like protein